MAFTFKSRKIQSQPVPGQPADTGQYDANRQIQRQFSGLTRAVAAAVQAGLAIGAGIQSVGVSNVNGSTGTAADTGHIHQGIHSITGPGGLRVGDVTFTGNLTQTLGTFTIGGQGVNFPFGTPNRVSVNYVVLGTDYAVFTTNTITVTLPAANIGASGYTVFVRNNDTSHTTTVAAAGADTIDGAATRALNPPGSSNPYCGAYFVSDGISRWSANFVGG